MSEHPTGGKMQLTDLLSSAELLSVEGPVYKTAGKPVYHSEKAEKNSIFFVRGIAFSRKIWYNFIGLQIKK